MDMPQIHFLVTVQGLFLAGLLVLRKPRTAAGSWLAGFILLVSVETLQMVLLESNIGGHVIGLTQPLRFLIGPVIYCFAISLAGRPGRRSMLHFAPFAVFLVYLAVVYFPLDAGAKQAALAAYIRGDRVFETAVVNIAASLHLTGYGLAVGRLFSFYRRLGGAYFSNTDTLRLKSIGFLTALALLTAGLQWFNYLYPYLGIDGTQASRVIVNSVFLLGGMAVYGMGIYALGRKDYLDADGTLWELSAPKTESSSEVKVIAAPELPPEVSCKDVIIDYMTSKQPYLDSNFTLKDLAAGVSLPSYRVSNTINRELGCNFFQLVNRYRVEAVKAVLDDPASKDAKLLAVAFDAGFASKASFNSIFKKLTGMTPSQYRDRKTR